MNDVLNMQVNVQCEGWFRLEKAKVDADGNEIAGTREAVADWFRNLITNRGLDMMPVMNYLSACHVGSGSATPAVTDTTLPSRIPGSSTIQSSLSETHVSAFFGFKTTGKATG